MTALAEPHMTRFVDKEPAITVECTCGWKSKDPIVTMKFAVVVADRHLIINGVKGV